MTQLTLDSVQHDFQVWRNARTGKSQIPKSLWDKALQLLEQYPISHVTKALHLSGGQVSAKRKEQRKKNSEALPITRPVNFVELNMPLPTSCDTRVASSGSKLEIKRADGAVLVIEGLAEQALFQVLSQFTEGAQ
jgi:hypothetical protein